MIDEATKLIVPNHRHDRSGSLAISRQRHHGDAWAILGRNMRHFCASIFNFWREAIGPARLFSRCMRPANCQKNFAGWAHR
jgi:hypothetical protein